MQPGNVDIGAPSIVKEQVGHSNVGDIELHIGTAARHHLKRQVADQAQDNCHILRGEAPQVFSSRRTLPRLSRWEWI